MCQANNQGERLRATDLGHEIEVPLAEFAAFGCYALRSVSSQVPYETSDRSRYEP